MNSILSSIKKLLGIAEEYTNFDQDLIMHINSVLLILNQMGVGPANGYTITDQSSQWSSFLTGDSAKLEFVKSYIYLKVRLLFDPPLSQSVKDSIVSMITELEWRISNQVDTTI